MSRALDSKPELTNARADYYARIEEHSMAPLWEVLHQLLATEPVTEASPHIWHYETVRPSIMESADVISAEEAERREVEGPVEPYRDDSLAKRQTVPVRISQ